MRHRTRLSSSLPGFLRSLFWTLLLCAAGGTRATLPIDSRAAPALVRFEFVAPQMGTLFRLVFFAPDETAAAAAAKAAFARVAELNRALSDYDPNSELMRLGQAPAGTAVAVSADLFDVLQQSQQLAGRSGGAFDVTLGPVVRLWRETRRTRSLPTAAARSAARSASGHGKLRLDPAARTVTLLDSGMQLDLGGIAKGYAADEALAVLERRGLPHAMVAASGDLALGAAPPGTAGWKIELRPFGEAAQERLALVAEHVGISTSGDAEQYVEIGGVRYSHIVDPATGLGLTKPVAVTVIARRAAQSDGLTTACSVLAVRDAAVIEACLGESARALVLRREAGGVVRRESYGASPPGVRTLL